MDDTASKIRKIISEHLGVELPKVTDGAALLDELGADSLDAVELTMACEEEFGIEVPDDAAQDVKTVGDLISVVKKIKGE